LALDLRVKNMGWSFIEKVIRKQGKKEGWKHLFNFRASDEFYIMIERNVSKYIESKIDLYESEKINKYNKS